VIERVEFKPKSIKDLQALPLEQRRRIMDKIDALVPSLAGDVKRLTNYTPEYRLRVGDYRVLFAVENLSAVVYRVLHRRDAYR
jgi:mRNA interferase RelE/StbE